MVTSHSHTDDASAVSADSLHQSSGCFAASSGGFAASICQWVGVTGVTGVLNGKHHMQLWLCLGMDGWWNLLGLDAKHHAKQSIHSRLKK